MYFAWRAVKKDFIMSASPDHLYSFLPTYFIHNVCFILPYFVKLVFNTTHFLLENNPLSEQGHVAVGKLKSAVGQG